MTWPTFWKSTTWQTQLLKPLAALTCRLARQRFQRFQQQAFDFYPRPKVIVVGNVVVGGSGKTPFIQWLGRQLQQAQVPFGIISRGYGGRARHYPLVVQQDTLAQESGDEPLMLKRYFDCPVVVAPKRREALQTLMRQYPKVKVVIADDGLQHFALPRDFEVALLDGQRGIGNGLCLPAGPLREPVERLQFVDAVVVNGGFSKGFQERGWEFCQDISKEKLFAMHLKAVRFRSVLNPEQILPLEAFAGQEVVAMAGIGNPQRFFSTLEALGMRLEACPLKDHQAMSRSLLQSVRSSSKKPLVMTAKDAVKCEGFKGAQAEILRDAWYLEIVPEASSALWQKIQDVLT